MLDEHRDGVSDHSRRLWTVLIFMLWHAIFVEHSVTPADQRAATRAALDGPPAPRAAPISAGRLGAVRIRP